MEKINVLHEDYLRHFTGSSQLYTYKFLSCSIKLTEGAFFLASEGKAFWLIDLILSYQWNPKFYKEGFQVWKLARNKDRSFVITCYDGNKNQLGRQDVPYSDFPLDDIELWVVDKVCMLKTEY